MEVCFIQLYFMTYFKFQIAEKTEEEDNVESLAGLNLNEDNIVKLASKGIKNKDDLAELSIDELQEVIDISEEDASKMIMKAREHWFD